MVYPIIRDVFHQKPALTPAFCIFAWITEQMG